MLPLAAWIALVAVGGCGRVGFRAGDDGGSGIDAASDAAADVAVPDARGMDVVEPGDGGPQDGGATPASYRLYPVPIPKAVGTVLLVVPSESAELYLFGVSGPRGTVYDVPVPATPLDRVTITPDRPYLRRIPEGTTTCPGGCAGCDACADEDHLFIVATTAPALVHVADDERVEEGSPDRLFFMSSTAGRHVGTELFANVKGTEPSERIRILNLAGVDAMVELMPFTAEGWVTEATVTVPALAELVYDPAITTPYRLRSTTRVMALVGWVSDNASVLAANVDDGSVAGSRIVGFGITYQLNALGGGDYTVEQLGGPAGWTTIQMGTLAPGGTIAEPGAVPTPTFLRMTMSDGKAWALTGLPNALTQNAWSGQFLPAYEPGGCTTGTTFETTGSGRGHVVIPVEGTTIEVRDSTDTLVETHSTEAPWEFHTFYATARNRIAVVAGAEVSLLQVGSLNFGNCDEVTMPGFCGIQEGGYTAPPMGIVTCPTTDQSPLSCSFTATCR